MSVRSFPELAGLGSPMPSKQLVSRGAAILRASGDSAILPAGGGFASVLAYS